VDTKIQVSCKIEEVLFTVRGESLTEVKVLYQEMYDQALVWVGCQSEYDQARRRPAEPAEVPLRPAPANLTQKANERAARHRVETQGELANEQVVCPEHGRALLGKYGLYCPTKLEDDTWCKWRPGRKVAA
jgi:hypothetical protein